MGAAPRESAQAFSNMDDDMEDYGFEYSDEEPEQEDVDIENQYYNSKGASKGALSFETVTV